MGIHGETVEDKLTKGKTGQNTQWARFLKNLRNQQKLLPAYDQFSPIWILLYYQPFCNLTILSTFLNAKWRGCYTEADLARVQKEYNVIDELLERVWSKGVTSKTSWAQLSAEMQSLTGDKIWSNSQKGGSKLKKIFRGHPEYCDRLFDLKMDRLELTPRPKHLRRGLDIVKCPILGRETSNAGYYPARTIAEYLSFGTINLG